MPSRLDWLNITVILTLVDVTIRAAGFRGEFEVMPWPDRLEYAASAVNLANSRSAVLHFGGYTYLSRHSGGYPLRLGRIALRCECRLLWARGQGGAPLPNLTRAEQPEGRIFRKSLAVVDILVARQPAIYRLPQQVRQR